jgi:transglutaminase-like putative cysteine protease
MRFGLVHRVMTDALAALGVLAVVNTASMSPWTNAVVLVGLALSLALPESWQNKPALRYVATIGPLALFLVQGARLVAGRSALDIAVEFAALLQVIRLATRRGAAHDQQILVLALLHFVAGTVLGGGLTYGICFLGFLIVAPGALVLSHLRREVEGNYRQGARDRTGLPVDVPRILRSRRVVGRGFLAATCLLSVPIFVFTAALFVLFPRVGLSLLLLNHPHQGRMVGFSDHVDLGAVGVLRTDPSIALRFDVSDLPEPPPPRITLRLRGTAFDAYDGRAWQRTLQDRHVAEHAPESVDAYPVYRYPNPAVDRKVSIDLEPIDPPVIFLPPRTVGIRVKPQNQALLGEPLSVHKGPEGELRYAGNDAHGLRYDAFLASDREVLGEVLGPLDRTRYLTIPPTLPTRLGNLAHEWADAQPNNYLKAKVLEDHLKREYRYDTNSPSGGKPQPLDHFLFESRRGHCEFFSTAMAMMLRELNIPSRNVTGFVGGTYNRFGRYYAVREGDAHSWVEAYIDDVGRPGWQTFDPTPSAGAQPLQETTGAIVYARDFLEALSQRWNRYVIGYDLRTQLRLFEDLSTRYETFRAKTGANKGVLDKVTRAPVIAAGLLVVATLAYVLWKRRQKTGPNREESAVREKIDKKLETATALYRVLEQALAGQGISRPMSLPPLRHAEELRARNHPLADEVVALTTVYLEARFGGVTLDEIQKKDFERRVKEIRGYRAPPAESRATSGPPPA